MLLKQSTRVTIASLTAFGKRWTSSFWVNDQNLARYGTRLPNYDADMMALRVERGEIEGLRQQALEEYFVIRRAYHDALRDEASN